MVTNLFRSPFFFKTNCNAFQILANRGTDSSFVIRYQGKYQSSVTLVESKLKNDNWKKCLQEPQISAWFQVILKLKKNNNWKIDKYSRVHQQTGQTWSTNCKSQFLKHLFKYFSRQIPTPYLTWYLTPNIFWFQGYFWILIQGRVICPNLMLFLKILLLF